MKWAPRRRRGGRAMQRSGSNILIQGAATHIGFTRRWGRCAQARRCYCVVRASTLRVVSPLSLTPPVLTLLLPRLALRRFSSLRDLPLSHFPSLPRSLSPSLPRSLAPSLPRPPPVAPALPPSIPCANRRHGTSQHAAFARARHKTPQTRMRMTRRWWRRPYWKRTTALVASGSDACLSR